MSAENAGEFDISELDVDSDVVFPGGSVDTWPERFEFIAELPESETRRQFVEAADELTACAWHLDHAALAPSDGDVLHDLDQASRRVVRLLEKLCVLHATQQARIASAPCGKTIAQLCEFEAVRVRGVH